VPRPPLLLRRNHCHGAPSAARYRSGRVPSKMVAGVHGPQRIVPLAAVLDQALGSPRSRRQLDQARSLQASRRTASTRRSNRTPPRIELSQRSSTKQATHNVGSGYPQIPPHGCHLPPAQGPVSRTLTSRVRTVASAPERRLSQALSEKALWEKASCVVDMSPTSAPARSEEAKGGIEEGKLASGIADTASDNASTTGSKPSVVYVVVTPKRA
jgi:hypothetical protein